MSRNQIFVEKAEPEDKDLLIQAMDSTPDNLCDPHIFSYPVTNTLKAVNGKPLVFMPIQTVFMLESLAIVNGSSPMEIAASLAELVRTVRWEARNAGHGEIYFLCKEQSTQQFAERHGFELVNVPCYRMRIR